MPLYVPAAASSGVSTIPSFFAAWPRTGIWHGPSINVDGDAGPQALVDEREVAVPFIVASPGTIDRIGVSISDTAGSTGSLLRLGIRANDNGYPGATVALDAGTVSGEVLTSVTITVSHAVTAGLHWLTVTSQGAAGTQPKLQSAGASVSRMQIHGHNSQGSLGNPDWFAAAVPSQTGVSGALPSSWTGTTRIAYYPVIAVRWA
jgi:hypothetical protein